jgi:hypothetical protein
MKGKNPTNPKKRKNDGHFRVYTGGVKEQKICFHFTADS